jgi:hypothetical protein
MATSGSTDFNLDVEQICQAALELIGVVPIGDTAGAEDMAKAMQQLNLMVKTWGAQEDPKLWLLTEDTQALSNATASYNLAAARKVLSVRRRTSSIDTPLTPWSRQQYFDQPNKSSSGYPTSYYFDPQQATRTLYVWPVPDSTIAGNTTLQYTYLRVIEDLDNFSDDFDVPQEWLEVLQYGLAARLTIPYRTHIADLAGTQLIQQRAADLYGQLAAFDDEGGSVSFSPDFQL